MRNKPHLFISYQEDGEKKVLGPFFTASIDGVWQTSWVTYEVQDAYGQFYRIRVPYYHTLQAILTPEGIDIY